MREKVTNFFKLHEKNIKYYTASSVVSLLAAFVICSLFFYNRIVILWKDPINSAFLLTCLSVTLLFVATAVLCNKKPCIFRCARSIFTVFQKDKLTLCGLICGAVVFILIFCYTVRMPLDYGAHTNLAVSFDFSKLVDSLNENSYPLWHIFVKLFSLLLPVPHKYCAALTSALFVLLTYRVTEKLIRELASNSFAKSFAPLFAAALTFVQPIYIPWFNKEQVFGQGSPNVFYNPTTIAAKPFAILCVYLLLKLWEKRKANEISVTDYVRLAVFALLSVVAKPSAIQVILPTLSIFLLCYLVYSKGKAFMFCLKTALAWLPALSWMAVVFYLSFVSQSTSDGNSIALSFFNVWSVYSPCIPVSILLAALFPLAVFAVFGRNGTDLGKQGTLFGAVCLLMGILEYGLIMETGDRMLHGNFSWGYIIGLGVFWTFATGHLLELKGQSRKKPLWIILTALFAVHLVFGIYYFVNTI